jgi:TonB family protein
MTFGPGPDDTRKANRAIAWSIGIHFVLVAALFLVPRDWLSKAQPRTVMTISLGGSPGERTSGRTSIGGRTIEQVAPPPRRPEPVAPTPPRQEAPPPPARTPPRTESPRPAQTPRATTPATRSPTTGAQVTQGNTQVDTGARGQGAGLTQGGGGVGGETDVANFCCPEYITRLVQMVEERWQKNQPERGTTVLRFTIQRDGTIDRANMQVLQPSGHSILDRVSRNAVLEVPRFPTLPAQYPNETLTIRLTFPYGS